MTISSRLPVLLVLASVLGTVGCNAVPSYQYRQSHARSMQLYRQGQQLSGQLGQAQATTQHLSAENQQLQRTAAKLQKDLTVAQQRLNNLTAEREQLHSQYRDLLTSSPSHENPLSGAQNQRFRELAEKYPDFEFDPNTGVSKFNADLLFASGSDAVRGEAKQLLREFAAIMNEPDARRFNILVVGHTDDRPIVKSGTKSQHETNWELSAHRASRVVRELGRQGLDEHRMGIAGYSMYQPVSSNADDSARAQNRRVEIFVLAPDAMVAGREVDAPR